MRVHTQPGGEIDYVVRGNMIGGVRPRGLSGAVSHFRLDDIPRQSSGAIYEKDLGWRTTDIALK
jgi:hypothetical protein